MRRSVTTAGALGAGSAVLFDTLAFAAARASDGADQPEAAPPVIKTEIARAVLEVGSGRVTFRGGKETSVTKVMAPGASSGWHRHPGSGMFLVSTGRLTTYGLDAPACAPVPVGVGKSLLFSAHAEHAHLVRNETTGPVTFTVLYFDLEPGQAGRADALAPGGCPDLT